jgi:hypothetical protein
MRWHRLTGHRPSRGGVCPKMEVFAPKWGRPKNCWAGPRPNSGQKIRSPAVHGVSPDFFFRSFWSDHQLCCSGKTTNLEQIRTEKSAYPVYSTHGRNYERCVLPVVRSRTPCYPHLLQNGGILLQNGGDLKTVGPDPGRTRVKKSEAWPYMECPPIFFQEFLVRPPIMLLRKNHQFGANAHREICIPRIQRSRAKLRTARFARGQVTHAVLPPFAPKWRDLAPNWWPARPPSSLTSAQSVEQNSGGPRTWLGTSRVRGHAYRPRTPRRQSHAGAIKRTHAQRVAACSHGATR